jgi:hypothetical protein
MLLLLEEREIWQDWLQMFKKRKDNLDGKLEKRCKKCAIAVLISPS